MNPDWWLTGKRLRAHALLLALSLWGIYFWTIATPTLRDRNGNLKGTDFLHFYTLGSLAAAHRGSDLYDLQAQAFLAAQRVPEARGIRYLPLYPPQVSILFAPLALLSYLPIMSRSAGFPCNRNFGDLSFPCFFPSDLVGTNECARSRLL